MLLYRGELKGLYVLLSRTRAGSGRQLSKSRNKFLATRYKPFSESLDISLIAQKGALPKISGVKVKRAFVKVSIGQNLPLSYDEGSF